MLTSKKCREPLELGYSAIQGVCKHGHSLQNNVFQYDNRLQSNLYEDLKQLYLYHDKLTLGIVRQRFLEHLNVRGYLSTDGKTRRQQLTRDFLQHYSFDELSDLGLSADYISQRNTFERVFWGDSLVINLPLLLLLIRFIAGSLEKFISHSTPYSILIPFGTGPWPCKNKLCPNYELKVIHKCVRIDNGYRGVSGRFSCDTCGSEYVLDTKRKISAKGQTKWASLGKVKKDEIFALYLNGGLTMKEIASRTYCTVYTVKQAIKTHLQSGVDEIACAAADQKSVKRDLFRSTVISVIEENPGLNRYQICLKSKTEYELLKKNDTAWLEEQIPASRSFDRINWSDIDEALSERVNKVARMLMETNPGTRVGVYSIIGALTKTESGRIKNYSQHLPKTQQMLQQSAETKEQYQFRHLTSLVGQLKNHYGYKEVTLDSILSYRRSYRGISEEMRNAIIAKLAEIQIV